MDVGSLPETVSLPQLRRMLIRAGRGTVTVSALRWHCKHGRLAPVSRKEAGHWAVPLEDAGRFVETYTRQAGGARG